PGNTLSWIDADVGNMPGLGYSPTDQGNGTYRDFSNITVPLPVRATPTSVFPITERSQTLSIYAPEYTTPYVQTFTLGVTRAVASNLTLDVRYIGTRGMKLLSTMNLDSPDFRSNALLKALDITRAG